MFFWDWLGRAALSAIRVQRMARSRGYHLDAFASGVANSHEVVNGAIAFNEDHDIRFEVISYRLQ